MTGYSYQEISWAKSQKLQSKQQRPSKMVFKTTAAGIKTAEKMGTFIFRFISGPIEQAVGIWEDKLKYMRWENQQRLLKRADELLEEMGLEEPTREIPLKLAVPFFQAASLEDDEYIQDKWAKLLVNMATSKRGTDLKRVYIDILERLSALDACLLDAIYKFPFQEMQIKGVITAKLPASTTIATETKLSSPEQPTEEVKLALCNLERLGCVAYPRFSLWFQLTLNGPTLTLRLMPALEDLDRCGPLKGRTVNLPVLVARIIKKRVIGPVNNL